MTEAEVGDANTVHLRLDGEDVTAEGEEITKHRGARLFFRGVLGAEQISTGWRCRSRREPPEALLLKIYDWLVSRSFKPVVEGRTLSVVDLELERRRSFNRTSKAAAALKSGSGPVSAGDLEQSLSSVAWSDARRLHEHQRVGAIHALTAVNAANFSVPGSGKTIVALAVAAAHWASDTIDLVLVVGPLASFDPWEQETEAALGGYTHARRIRGDRAERQLAYDRAAPPEVLLVNYATAAGDQLALLDLLQRFRVMLIVDESHRVKRFQGGYWAPALIEIAKRARVRMILSGTPMPQSGRDLFTQLNVLWPGGELTGTRGAFATRVDNDFSGVIQTVEPFIYRTPKEALGLPPYQVERHEVPITGTQRDVYELIENRFRRQIATAATWRDKIEALRRGRPIRLLQAAANPDLFNMYDVGFGLDKLENTGDTLMERLARFSQDHEPAKSMRALALVEEVVENDGKVVCWSNFVANLDAFSNLVREELGIQVFQIDGRVPAGTDALREEDDASPGRVRGPETRESIIHRFLTFDGPAALVTNPASCSESISLHSACHTAIYLDRTYDAALFLQSIDRIHRLGLPVDAEVEIHLLMATRDGQETIDHLVDAALRRKQENMRRLLEGAEIAPLGIHDDPIVDAEGDEQDLADLLRYLIGESE